MTTQLESATEQLWERWPPLSRGQRLKQFRKLHTGEKADFFLELSAHDQSDLLLDLPQEQRHVWMRLLAPDDAADVIQEAGPEYRGELLFLLDESTRREVTVLLAYKEDEAGGLMNPRFARLRPESTVDEAISYLREEAPTVDHINYAYVPDQEQHLLGVVSLRLLFSSDPNKMVQEVMKTDLVWVSPETDQKEVSRIVRDSRLLAVPVLDMERRMVGIVTVDDIVDVVEEEASRDIQKLGGMEALDTPYLHTTLIEMVRKRAGWLAILFIGEMFTATAMGFFEDEISKAVVLALFLPLIHQQRWKLRIAGDFPCDSGDGIGRCPVARLVPGHPQRANFRSIAGRHSRRHWSHAHLHLAVALSHLRSADADSRADNSLRPYWRCYIWDNCRIDAAVYPAAIRP